MGDAAVTPRCDDFTRHRGNVNAHHEAASNSTIDRRPVCCGGGGGWRWVIV